MAQIYSENSIDLKKKKRNPELEVEMEMEMQIAWPKHTMMSTILAGKVWLYVWVTDECVLSEKGKKKHYLKRQRSIFGVIFLSQYVIQTVCLFLQ